MDMALLRLAEAGAVLNYTHQNIAEFWSVATRPADRNGFGLSPVDADREIRAIEKGMVLLPDSEAIYHEWRRLVVVHAVSGVQVHDARLAAAMKTHVVTHLLTLNTERFQALSTRHRRPPRYPRAFWLAPIVPGVLLTAELGTGLDPGC